MALGITPIEIVNKGTHPLLVKDEEWERVELHYVADVQNGYAFSSELFNHKNGLPLIRIRDIFSAKTENYYSGKYDEDYVVNHNDILIGMDGDFKISRWPGQKGLLNQRVCRIKFFSSHYLESFLFICVQPFLDAIHSETSAVTVKHLSSRTINDIPLPLPPLPIQRAIVSKIEALFSDLDNGIANFKKAQEQLKVYRQAVLKKAFEGELTKEWREKQIKNYELGITNEELRITNEKLRIRNEELGIRNEELRMRNKENQENHTNQDNHTNQKNHSSDNLPEGWKWVKFEDVLEIVSGKNQKQVQNPNGKYPIYGSGGIFGKADDYLCEAGTTIIGRKGTIDTPIYVNERFWNVDTAFGLSPFEILNNKFLYYFCQSFNFKNLDKSTTIPSLAKRDLLKIDIPLPPTIQEQTQIVQEIESRLSVTDNLEFVIRDSIEKAEALRQSILKKAFEGKLLSEAEIEQCKKEADYEPAGELLKKIANEKLRIADGKLQITNGKLRIANEKLRKTNKKKGGKNGK